MRAFVRYAAPVAFGARTGSSYSQEKLGQLLRELCPDNPHREPT